MYNSDAMLLLVNVRKIVARFDAAEKTDAS